MNILDFFNGKKTLIGGILLFGGTVLEQVIVGIWGISGDWVQPTIQTLDWVGMVVFGVGGGHKIIKAKEGNK